MDRTNTNSLIKRYLHLFTTRISTSNAMENNDNVKIMKSYYNILEKIVIFTKKRKIFTIKTTFIQQIIIFFVNDPKKVKHL